MSPDRRLLLPAAAAWLGSLAVQVAAVRALIPAIAIGVLVVAGGALAAVTSVSCLRREARSGGVRCGRAWSLLLRWRWSLALAIIALVLGGASAAIHRAELDQQPLATWTQARLTADVTGVVTTPVRSRSVTGGAIWAPTEVFEQGMATTTVWVRGTGIELQQPMVLRLESPSLALPQGTQARWRGRLLEPQDDAPIAGLLLVSRAPAVLRPPGPVDAVANSMRSGLVTALDGLPVDGAALVAGLAVGDESLQTPELADAMRASGLSHLTAVSGGNTAIVCGIVLIIAAWLRVPILARALVAGAVLVFYVVLVGPQPSVLRAAVMGGIMLIAVVVGGRGAGASALGMSVLVLVMVSPGLAVSWGFALSVVATAGLILLAPVIEHWLSRLPRVSMWRASVRQALAVTLAAQLSTMPILLLMGSKVGWVSVPANLLAAPAVAPVTVLGLLIAVIAPSAPGLAAVLGHAAVVPALWIAGVARTTSHWPYAVLPWPSGVAGVLALALVVVGVVVARWLVARRWPTGMPGRVRHRMVAGACAGLLLLGLLRQVTRAWPPPDWLVIACDVGQGDALLLRSANDAAVVVDVGPRPEGVRTCLNDAGVRRVDAVVLTHFHADHVAGLRGVLDSYAVPVILTGPLPEPADQYANVIKEAANRATPMEVIAAGEIRAVGAVTWRALWPRRIIDSGSVPNNASVVLVATVAGHQLLLCGDVEPEAQAAIASDLPGLHLSAVKVPHHGSRFQNPLLPQWARAPIALISVGADNDYGHPSADTIRAWQAAGSLVGRTDLDGDLAVVSLTAGAVGLTARGK